MAVDYNKLKENGFMQQIQKNTFSLRLKVVGGNLTAEQLLTIAQVSQKYGKGYVHLTSRQGVEIPFIKLKDIESVKSELESGGIYTGACGPRVRTVTACHGNRVCRHGCIDTYGLAQEISERYSDRKLPHKFKIGVTGCMNNCLKAEENDIGIKGGYTVTWQAANCTLCGLCVKSCRQGALSKENGEIVQDKEKCNHCGRCAKVCSFGAFEKQEGFLLSFGGTFGNRISKGRQFLPIIHDKETVFRVADAALDFFEKNAKGKERSLISIERAGWECFENYILSAYSNNI